MTAPFIQAESRIRRKEEFKNSLLLAKMHLTIHLLQFIYRNFIEILFMLSSFRKKERNERKNQLCEHFDSSFIQFRFCILLFPFRNADFVNSHRAINS